MPVILKKNCTKMPVKGELIEWQRAVPSDGFMVIKWVITL